MTTSAGSSCSQNLRTRHLDRVCYTGADQAKVAKLLTELNLTDRVDIVVIDARGDNKPTGSKA